MQWTNSHLTTAEIRNTKGGVVKLRNGTKTASIALGSGQTLRLNADLAPAAN
jgi:hypothetical protein